MEATSVFCQFSGLDKTLLKKRFESLSLNYHNSKSVRKLEIYLDFKN